MWALLLTFEQSRVPLLSVYIHIIHTHTHKDKKLGKYIPRCEVEWAIFAMVREITAEV